jgi:hypothetical protein
MREEIKTLNSKNAYYPLVQNLVVLFAIINMKSKMYRHVILPFKRGEAAGDWRKLHNEELCDV